MVLLLVKGEKRCSGQLLFAYFGPFWKEINIRVFENEEQSVEGLKHAFLYNLWDWSGLFLISGPSSIADFVA